MMVTFSIPGEPQGKDRAGVVWDWRLSGESGGLNRRNSRMSVTEGRKNKNDQEIRYSRLPGVAGDAKPRW